MCQRCHGTYVSEMPRNIRVRDVTEHLSEMPRNTCVRDGHGTPVLKMPRSTCVRDATEHLCQRWPWICSVCRSHNCALLNSVISYYLIFHKTTTTDATIRTGSNQPYGALKITRNFQLDSCCSIFSALCFVNHFCIFVHYHLVIVISVLRLTLLVSSDFFNVHMGVSNTHRHMEIYTISIGY